MLERLAMKRLALGVVGLGAGQDKDPSRFLALIAQGETADAAKSMSSMSTCGLTVRGLWRRIGMRDPRLEAPYVPASVMTSIVAMAKEAGAWSESVAGLGVGDVIYVSEPDHVGTIVRVDRQSDGSASVTTVDGGSIDSAGYQEIVSYDRSIGADGTVLSGPMAGNGRRVLCAVSLPPMLDAFGGGSWLGDAAAVSALALVGWAAWRHRRRFG